MKKPFWFNIVEQWKIMEKGEYGVTFPFLIGAIARINKQDINRDFVSHAFKEIINEPVSGYYGEVRWCGNIEEPVISIKETDEIHNVSIQASFSEKNKAVSLAFTTDLMNMFNLDCATKEECLSKLIAKTLDSTKNGEFSKNNGVFTAFNKDDIEFIEEVSTF